MKRCVTLGAALCLAAGVAGCSGDDPSAPAAGGPAPTPSPAAATFDVTDEAGYWFDTGNPVAGTRSLAIIKPGEKVRFLQTRSENGPTRMVLVRLVWRASTPSPA